MSKENIWKEYNEFIAELAKSTYLNDVLTSIWNGDNSIEISATRIDLYVPGETTLPDLYQRIATALPDSPESHDDIFKVNLQQFFGFLHVILQYTDTVSSGDSPILKAMFAFFKFNNAYSHSLLSIEELCERTYVLGFEKLLARHKLKYEISSNFLFALNSFLGKQTLSFDLTGRSLAFLIEHGSGYCNMIQNLSMFDKTCQPGFLSFVCLSTLILKKHEDKTKILIYMFSTVSEKLTDIQGLSEMRVGIMHSNFQLLIRQVGKQMTGETVEIVTALLRVGPYYSSVKPIALLVNQLPFSIYSKLVLTLHKIICSHFKPERQEFAFNLLESPYIIGDDSQYMDHFNLLMKLFETVVYPIQSRNLDQVHKTVHYFIKVLTLQDKTTLEALKLVLTKSKTLSISNILNYIFERTNPLWADSSCNINQCFVSIVCNYYMLVGELPFNNFLQFEVMVVSADVITLIPCIPILVKTLKENLYRDSDVTYLIATTLATNAVSPNMQYSRYLEALFRLMFEDGENGLFGIKVCTILINYGVDVATLISKMQIQNYLKDKHLTNLCHHVHEEGGLKLIETVVNVFQAPLIPVMFNDFCMDFIKDPMVFMDKDLKLICSIITKVGEKKKQMQPHERELIKVFLEFSEENLVQRKFPTAYLKTIVITTKKLKEYFGTKYDNLLAAFKDIEKRYLALEEYVLRDDSSLTVPLLTRDMIYFSEFATVFGEIPGFAASDDAIKVTIDFVSMPISKLLDLHEITDSVLQTATILALRSESLMTHVSKTLNVLVYAQNEKLQIVSLYCLHDITVVQTQQFDYLLGPICFFMKSPEGNLQLHGLRLFMRLIDKEYVIPNHWQLYTLTFLIASEKVHEELGRVEIYNFINKLSKSYERYFINILLYFNTYYNHPNYLLSHNDLSKIPTQQVALDSREAIYRFILRSFSAYTLHKIVNHLYNEICRNMFLSPLKYVQNYELIQDVMSVTFIVLKQAYMDYAKGNIAVYLSTVKKIKDLQQENISKDVPETDNDSTIKNVLTCLIDLMQIPDVRINYIIPELIHVLLSVCEWYFDNICNIILSEKKTQSFLQTMKKLPELFNSFKHLIHSSMDQPMDQPLEEATTSLYHRI